MIKKYTKNNNKARKTNKNKSSKKNYKSKSKKNLVGGANNTIKQPYCNINIDKLINIAARSFVNKIYISTGTTNNNIEQNISKVYEKIDFQQELNNIPKDPRLLNAIKYIIKNEIIPKYKLIQLQKNTNEQKKIIDMEADMKALREYKEAIIKKNDKYFNDVSTSEYYTYLRNNGIEPQSYCAIL
jgi:hypothetical protein